MHQSYLQKIDEIANTLLSIPRKQGIGLYSGNAGISLFLFYYAREKRTSALQEKASEILDNIFEQIETTPQPPFSLCSGIAGVGWLIDHLCSHGFLHANPDEILADIDEYLFFVLVSDLKRGYFDFMHGAMGTLFYFVKRKRKDYLHLMIQALADIAVWKGDYAKWQSVIIPKEGIKGFNISLSHGSSSIALVLCKILQIMPEETTAKALLKGTIEYIINQEIPVKKYGSFFPSISIESRSMITKSRLAWCYGDLGVALAIWKSGIALQKQTWINKGLEVFLFSAQRRGLLENSIQDAGICHGTSGVTQFFNRLYHDTKLMEFKEAADYWAFETLKMAIYEDGLAGYKSWRLKEKGGSQSREDLLEGIAGIGLSLLSFVMPEEPAWDECLLLS